MKKDLVTKPNQLIELIGAVKGVQTKMYNVVLARAHRELKLEDKEEFYLDLKDIKVAAGVNDKNDNRVRKYLSDLLKTSIEYTDSKGDWGGFNLISSYKKKGSQIKIGLPKEIRVALINNDYYSTLDLLMMRSLEGKHAITLYEIAIKYHKVQIPEYKVEDFRKLTDTFKSKSYDNFARLKAKVIEPAIEEINAKTDIEISYTQRKVGKKVEFLRFKVTKKSSIPQNITFGGNLNLKDVEVIDDKKKSVSSKTIKSKIRKKEIQKEEKVFADKIKGALSKVKRNIYVSKAWNKRADNKVQKLLKDYGEDYTLEILDRLYKGAKQEIKTTVVQYINGIMKNVQAEGKDNKPKQKKITELVVKEVPVPKAKEEAALKNVYISIEEFNRLDDEKKKVLEEKAVKIASEKESIAESFLLGLKSKSFSIYFNMINKYMERP